MKKIILGMLALASVWSSAWATEKSFTSPDGKLTVVVEDQNGVATYRVNVGTTEFIGSSPLGVNTNIGNYTSDLTLAGCEVNEVKESYDLRNIKRSHVDYEAIEAVCSFEQKGKKVMDVIFRVSNRDVAYRYRILPQRDTKVCVIESEASGFQLPEGTTTFMCPQSRPMGGFARTSPSYETSYTDDDQMGKNGWGEGYSFPCLFHLGDKGWVLISETGVDGGYVASRLLNVNGGLYKIGFPQPGECNGWGSTSASVALPCETPWRTITLGTTLAPIVETTVPFDLVAPKYKASQEYIYGKGSWSWIIGMDASCNYDEQKRYIDFSAAMGYQTVLIDALWDKQIGYEKIAELAAYGKTKGVGLFLWYNSNGSWNDAPQSPLGKMDKSRERRAEMAWMKRVGIRGIKVDFFGGDRCSSMRISFQTPTILAFWSSSMVAPCLVVGNVCTLTMQPVKPFSPLRISTSDKALAMLRHTMPPFTPSSATPLVPWTLVVPHSISSIVQTTSVVRTASLLMSMPSPQRFSSRVPCSTLPSHPTT